MTLQYRVPCQDHWLVTVDTGKRKAGIALWRVLDCDGCWESRLTAVELVRTRQRSWHAQMMVDELVSAVEVLLAEAGAGDDDLVVWLVEKPRKLKNKQVAHRDLEDLLEVVKRLKPPVQRATGRAPKPVFPSKWKGGVPKPAHQPRILRAIRPGEPRSTQKDVVDAIGIGLWATGRTGRGGVRVESAAVQLRGGNDQKTGPS